MANQTMRIVEGELKGWRATPGVEGLEAVFEFLERTDLRALPLGRTTVDGDDVFALVSEGQSKPVSEARFEAHRRYIDVQCAIEGQEAIGYAPLADLKTSEAYDDKKDIEFFSSPSTYSSVALKAGRFAVFGPQDGHQPGAHLDGPHAIRKVVVKVSVAYRDRRRGASAGR